MNKPEAAQSWPYYPVEPIIKLEGGFSPFDVWLECRAAHQLWRKVPDNRISQDKHISDDNRLQAVQRMCRRLSSFPARRWLNLNSAIGWTPEAAAAQTWCQDALLDDTIHICNHLQYLASPARDADFCAQLLNPSLLPSNRLSTLVQAGGRQLHGISLLIAARPDLPEIDVSTDILQHFPGHLLSMLHARSNRGADVSESRPAAVSHHAVPTKAAIFPERHMAETDMQKNDRPADQSMNNAADNKKQETLRRLIERTQPLRGWTESMITAAKAEPAQPVMITEYGECYRHSHPDTGACIIVSAADGELVHVGRPGFAYRPVPDQAYQEDNIDNRYIDPFYDPQTRRTMIWVPLKYELAEVWCPTPASHIEKDIYCILPPSEDNRNESTHYTVTAYVLCRPLIFHDGVHMAAVRAALL